MKRPSFQFYPGDWLQDINLRSCSVEARGLWIDMMCFMHQAPLYGYLIVGSKGIDKGTLSRMTGVPLENIGGLLHELQQAGVFSVDDSGVIYSRRMIRDEEIRRKRAEGGALSVNHPNTIKPKGYPTRVPLPEPIEEPMRVPFDPPPSSSSSSSSTKQREIVRPSAEHSQFFIKFWEVYPRKDGKAEAYRKWRTLKLDKRFDEIITGLEKLKKSKQWEDKSFVPMAKTFLQNARWEDEPPAAGFTSKPAPKLNPMERLMGFERVSVNSSFCGEPHALNGRRFSPKHELTPDPDTENVLIVNDCYDEHGEVYRLDVGAFFPVRT